MTDQDGVLFDKSYQSTGEIKSLVKQLSNDILIVPNSDTPILRAQRNFKRVLGVTPNIVVGEKGAIVLFKKIKYPLGNVRGIDDFLESLKQSFSQIDCEIVVGDSATWIREKKMFTPNRKMLIIDGLREQTIGFYLRATDSQGIAQIDNQWFEEGSDIVRKLEIPEGLIAEDFNSQYGIVIMNTKDTDKTTGYNFLSDQFPDATFFMIGDNDADIIREKSVIHCAVKNASQSLKSKSAFASNKPFTEGLRDCLDWINLQ